ncbi:MAG: response regulator transcription factor [Acidimicrobiales bacterium]
MIRVAVVDDSEMIRTGFGLIIDNEDDMTVVGQAATGVEAIEVCRTRRVDVVLMDIRMPDMDGLTATEQVLALPDPPSVLVLTTFGLDDYVTQAISVGAAGFLLKDASADALVDAVRAVAQGDSVLSPAITRLVMEQARSAGGGASQNPVPGLDELTDRERDVLEQLACGRSNAEIAAALFLSEATVKTHVGRVLTKLGVRDRVQAVILAFRAGIADPNDLTD